MDGRSFDDLTRKLAKGANRRSLLKGLLGGAGAVAASAVAKHGAEATHCNPSISQQTPCPGGPGELPTTAMGGLGGACCNGHGNCCSQVCVDFGQSHEGACAPTASESTTTPAPGPTTTPAPGGTTTPAPGGSTTPAPDGTTAGPEGTTLPPTGGVAEVPATGVGEGASGPDLLGITLAGGAAALVAAKVLRNKPSVTETPER